MKPTVFLGGGRITSALIAGLRRSKYKTPVIVHDRNPKKLLKLQKQYGVAVENDLGKAVRAAGLLVFAVRPSSVSELLKAVGRIERRLISVSLAAGIPLSRLQKKLPSPVHWARAMPSPVSRTGLGLTAVTFPRGGLTSRDRRLVKEFFTNVGMVVEIPESQFDAFTVAYSSSHGYHALATLAKAAERNGLDRRIALIAAAHALADGIAFWRAGKIPLQTLMREAQTPGGIAAAVIQAMDKGGYSRLVEKSLHSGLARARANARL